MGASRWEAWRQLYNKCAKSSLTDAVSDLTLADRGHAITTVPMLLVGMLFGGSTELAIGMPPVWGVMLLLELLTFGFCMSCIAILAVQFLAMVTLIDG